MTMEYWLENRSSDEPKFYPCKLMVGGEGKKGKLLLVCHTILENREEYLALKRDTIRTFTKLNVSKDKQIKLLLDTFYEDYQSGVTRQPEVLQRLALLHSGFTALLGDEILIVRCFWTKAMDMSSFEADGKMCSICMNCKVSKKLEELSKCGGCNMVCYCSKECQKKHWKTHKKDCQTK